MPLNYSRFPILSPFYGVKEPPRDHPKVNLPDQKRGFPVILTLSSTPPLPVQSSLSSLAEAAKPCKLARKPSTLMPQIPPKHPREL